MVSAIYLFVGLARIIIYWLLYARWQPCIGIATDYNNCLIKSSAEHQTQEMAWLPFGLIKLLLDLNCRMLDQLPITSVTEL